MQYWPILLLLHSKDGVETLVGEITAILPAYNEEVSIGSIVLRTREYADRVIVVDDGSLDRTAEVAALAGAQVLRHEMNLGKGAALKTGFSLLNGDAVIVTIDTDGQHDPADIPRLVRPILREKRIWSTAAVISMAIREIRPYTVEWARRFWMWPPTSAVAYQ